MPRYTDNVNMGQVLMALKEFEQDKQQEKRLVREALEKLATKDEIAQMSLEEKRHLLAQAQAIAAERLTEDCQDDQFELEAQAFLAQILVFARRDVKEDEGVEFGEYVPIARTYWEWKSAHPEGQPDESTLRKMLNQLEGLQDPMPDEYCTFLGLPQGSTYGAAVDLIKSTLSIA